MATRLPPPLLFRVTWAGQRSSEWDGLVTDGENSQVWVWLFRGALSGNSAVFAFAAFANCVRKGSYHTTWAVPCGSSCTSSYAYGRGTAVGPQSGERCWPLLAGLSRAIAPLMKPWCAEGDLPTAANLNFYRGRSSHVGWQSDDELLFGERKKAKLTVSVSVGTSGALQMEG